MLPRHVRLLIFSIFMALGNCVQAQINFGKGVVLSGNTSFTYQYYQTDTFNGGFAPNRQPTHLPRFNGNFELDIQGKLRLPIELRLAPVVQVSGFGVNTPAEGPGSLTILRYLSHPANHIAVHPTYRGISFHLGHFILPYSPLTVGDIKVMGVGADYSRGRLSYAVQRGVIQPKVANVDFNINAGSYRRSLTAFRVGHQSTDQWKNAVSFALAGDDSSSLDNAPMGRRPQRSAAIAYIGSYKIDARSRLHYEVASTSWAPDFGMTDTLREFGVANFLMPNTTVFGGIGLAINGQTEWQDFNFSGKLNYRSKNFKTLAYPFMQSDMLDMQIASNYTSPDRKLQASGSLAYLGSNLSEERGSRLNIPVLRLVGGYRYNEHWMANVTYTGNRLSSTPNAAGQSVRSSNQLIRLLPSYSFTHWEVKSAVSLILGLSSNSNSSDFLPQSNKVSTRNYGLSYRAAYQKHSATLSVNSFSTINNGTLAYRYNTLTLSGTTRLLEDALLPFARITFTSASNADMKLGTKRMTQMGARYRLNNQLAGSLSINIHYSKQGIDNNSPGYREYITAFGIQYRL